MVSSSVCIYWAGMALNDYADAAVDSVERPGRPIPSGRVPRRAALKVAGGLTAAGLGLAALSGGRRGLAVAVPLSGLVWAYDLALKSTPAGPAAMAGARALNVLAGARAARPALPAALAVGLHTYTVMQLSRHEVSGAPASVPARTLAGSTAVGLAAAVLPWRHSGGKNHRRIEAPQAMAALGAAGYAATYGRAQARALGAPTAENVQRAVGAGILGLIPLQAALTAGAGAVGVAAALAGAHPLARLLSRKVSLT